MTHSTDRWNRISEIFQQIRLAEPSERAALLDSLTEHQPDLRDEVESLLAHHDAAHGAFLEPPELDFAAQLDRLAQRPDPLIGRQFDHYTIRSALARGGMGVVYLADQDRPRRAVALKVMRAGIASAAALKRFEYESQVLGALQHPNIAQV